MINAKQRKEIQADHSRVSRQVIFDAGSNISSGIVVEEHVLEVSGNVSLTVNSIFNHSSLGYKEDF